MKRILYWGIFICSFTVPAIAQHNHTTPMNDTMMHQDHQMMKNSMKMNNMSNAFSINLPMSRDGSGTSWSPDASPMYGNMFHANDWMFMLHWNLFLRYNNQDFTKEGSRGGDKFDTPDWLMFMGQRKLRENGLVHFNTMFSLDAVSMGSGGYPLLFQSGETYKGQPLVDKQHPHDLFSELSISYSHSLD